VTKQWETDMFGNRVCRVEAERVDHAVDFEARFCVRREPATAPSTADLHDRFLTFTALTRPDERIQRVAQEIASSAENPRRRVSLAHNWAADAIEYRPGVTGTQTPAAMALHLGQGVCQDYAHILLALLRTLRIAARYVSGHLTGDGPPHAWVEALLPDSTVVGCDPTHQREGDVDYIVVASGRDFADVTSTSGVFTGSATGKLHWSKHASRLQASLTTAA
jgi:transglutaminase-like putative cysteine protease